METAVPVFDFNTKEKYYIPTSELAPGMIWAEVKGVGCVWVHAPQTKVGGPFRHPPFDEEIRQVLRQIKAALDEVFYETLNQWEDGFRRDQHPEKEIAIWCHIASTYRACVNQRKLTKKQRQEYFRVIVVCANGPRKNVFKLVNLSAISRKEAESAVELFYSDQRARGVGFGRDSLN